MDEGRPSRRPSRSVVMVTGYDSRASFDTHFP
jgi:hypothetical protein